MSKKTTKKAKPAIKWFDHAAKLQVGLFFTTMGPIIGKVDKAPADMGQFRVRLWAPAMLQVGMMQPDKNATTTEVMQQRVVYQPLAFIETYIDLSVAAPSGRAPVPASLMTGYEEYFAKFTQGAYELRRVVTKVETGAPHVVETPVEPSKSESDSNDPANDESTESHVS